MLLLPHLPTVMIKLPLCISHPVLLWLRVMVMLRFLSRAPAFLASPPLLLFALTLPCKLTAAVDALSGSNSHLLLLLLLTISAQAPPPPVCTSLGLQMVQSF
jgi:hypothetical protein